MAILWRTCWKGHPGNQEASTLSAIGSLELWRWPNDSWGSFSGMERKREREKDPVFRRTWSIRREDSFFVCYRSTIDQEVRGQCCRVTTAEFCFWARRIPKSFLEFIIVEFIWQSWIQTVEWQEHPLTADLGIEYRDHWLAGDEDRFHLAGYGVCNLALFCVLSWSIGVLVLGLWGFWYLSHGKIRVPGFCPFGRLKTPGQTFMKELECVTSTSKGRGVRFKVY